MENTKKQGNDKICRRRPNWSSPNRVSVSVARDILTNSSILSRFSVSCISHYEKNSTRTIELAGVAATRASFSALESRRIANDEDSFLPANSSGRTRQLDRPNPFFSGLRIIRFLSPLRIDSIAGHGSTECGVNPSLGWWQKNGDVTTGQSDCDGGGSVSLRSRRVCVCVRACVCLYSRVCVCTRVCACVLIVFEFCFQSHLIGINKFRWPKIDVQKFPLSVGCLARLTKSITITLTDTHTYSKTKTKRKTEFGSLLLLFILRFLIYVRNGARPQKNI